VTTVNQASIREGGFEEGYEVGNSEESWQEEEPKKLIVGRMEKRKRNSTWRFFRLIAISVSLVKETMMKTGAKYSMERKRSLWCLTRLSTERESRGTRRRKKKKRDKNSVTSRILTRRSFDPAQAPSKKKTSRAWVGWKKRKFVEVGE